jgi:hypothetical protein
MCVCVKAFQLVSLPSYIALLFIYILTLTLPFPCYIRHMGLAEPSGVLLVHSTRRVAKCLFITAWAIIGDILPDGTIHLPISMTWQEVHQLCCNAHVASTCILTYSAMMRHLVTPVHHFNISAKCASGIFSWTLCFLETVNAYLNQDI